MTGPSVNNNYNNILAELGWPIKNGELSSQLAGQQWVKSLKGLLFLYAKAMKPLREISLHNAEEHENDLPVEETAQADNDWLLQVNRPAEGYGSSYSTDWPRTVLSPIHIDKLN